MKKKLKFEAQQYGKSYKKPRRNKCMEIKIHALYHFVRRGAERPPALPNAFSAGNIAEKPGGEKDGSGSSEGDVSGISAFRRQRPKKREAETACYAGRRAGQVLRRDGRPKQAARSVAVGRTDGRSSGLSGNGKPASDQPSGRYLP